jgi:protein ImuB
VPTEVRDGAGRAVVVTDRGVVSGPPTRWRIDGGWQPVVAWAGPWPVDESWWSDSAARSSRFQVVGADGRAWLLVCGPDGWGVEAGYD